MPVTSFPAVISVSDTVGLTVRSQARHCADIMTMFAALTQVGLTTTSTGTTRKRVVATGA